MKTRVLKKLLNTDRSVCNYGEYLAIGSAYVHNLISLDVKTLKVRYALDSYNQGRQSLLNKSDGELLDIWDKLHELIENGQMKDILEGDDVLENSLTVYTVKDGELVETTTDAYGWPNVTYDGKLMHDNTYFKTKEEAIDKYIEEYQYEVKHFKELLAEKELELKKRQDYLDEAEKKLENLLTLKNKINA